MELQVYQVLHISAAKITAFPAAKYDVGQKWGKNRNFYCFALKLIINAGRTKAKEVKKI